MRQLILQYIQRLPEGRKQKYSTPYGFFSRSSGDFLDEALEFKKNSDWCLTAHAMFVKVCQVTARETNLQILFKRLTKRNSKKCLTKAKRLDSIYKLSQDESTTNLENQRSINTQTLKILKNFQRPAMVKRSKDRANLFAVKQRTEQS